MFHIVLYQPEIPPNTGNIIRLCANTGCWLHLIKPLGFDISSKALKRAGLDYYSYVKLQVYNNLEEFLLAYSGYNIFLCSTKAKRYYHNANFKASDILIFGPESRGLPDNLLASYADDNKIKIPMHKTYGRSINLATAVGIIVYEGLRQNNFLDCI